MTERSMDAGRELDVLIAEKVMGWKREGDFWQGLVDTAKSGHSPQIALKTCTQDGLPYYSTDIGAAWEIVDRFYSFKIRCHWEDGNENESPQKDGFVVELTGLNSDYNDGESVGWGLGKTVPHAICLAALKATETYD